MWWWDSRLFHERTASADAVIVAAVAATALERTASALSEDASEPPDESVRSSGGRLSIPELTWWHAVVGQSLD